MRKIFTILTMITLITTVSACSAYTNNESLSFDTNEDVISFQALTASSLIANENLSLSTGGLSGQLLSNEQNEGDDPITETTEDPTVDQIEPYIELVEQLLGSNNGLSVTTETSDLEAYETKMTFQTSTLNNGSESYTIYYNMTLKDEEDDESEYVLDGIMLLNDVEYIVSGKREVEDDEEKIEFIAKLDEFNYVESEYKVEEDENKFDIQVVSNGILISHTNIKIEEEDNETKIELEFIDGSNSGAYEFKYELEDGENTLKIEYETMIDGVESRGEIKVLVMNDEVTGETYYQVYVQPEDDEAYEDHIDRDIDDEEDEEEDEEDDEEDDEESDEQ